nr:FAD-dependent oxidoreductase [Pseudonocardia acidicola]
MVVVVVGAGPAGESVAQMAAGLGYSVALAERDAAGGTVVTSGGAPTKTFRETALYLTAFEKERVLGISPAAPPEVIYPALSVRAHTVSAVVQQTTLERLHAVDVRMVYGSARLEDGHTVPDPRGSRSGNADHHEHHACPTPPPRHQQVRRGEIPVPVPDREAAELVAKLIREALDPLANP